MEILQTERLLLRPFAETDIKALYAILSDETANRFLPWFPVKTMEEARAFYEREYAHGYHYAICLKEDGIPIGYVNIGEDAAHDMGYGLRTQFWHRGIVTEACLAVIEQAKRDGFPYITATHDRNNPRSGNVMQKIGMTYRYSYEERWMPKDMMVIFRMYQMNFTVDTDFVFRKYWNQYENHFVEKI